LFFVSFTNLTMAQDLAQKVEIPESEPSGEEMLAQPPTASKLILKPINKSEKIAKKGKKKSSAADDETQDTIKPEVPLESNLVILQGLNKVMGRVYPLEVPLGTVARFENLEIIARKCVKSKPEEPLENAALLEIREVKTDEEPKQVFLGWMFSSSPSISSLEHPVYDVTVISCDARANLEGAAE